MKRLAVMVVLSALILLIVYPANEMLGASDEVKIFDKLFQRETGKPRNEHFSIFATEGPATIKVYNGDGEEWLKRATSAEIKINNKTILTPGDFKKKTTVLEKETNLSIGENTIDVILFGMPEVKIRVEISQGVNNNIPLAGLLGVSDKAASEAVFDFDSNDTFKDNEVTYFEDGDGVVRTQLGISFNELSTIGGINSLLRSIEGKIIGMLEGVNWLIIRIPDAGDLGGLEDMITYLKTKPEVNFLVKARIDTKDSLPSNISLQTQSKEYIDHLLAIKAHAAWNAVEALRNPIVQARMPVVIIKDYFGAGPNPPLNDYDVHQIQPLDFMPNLPKPNNENPHNVHGYAVLSVIAARFGGAETDRGLATGIVPVTVPIRVVDSSRNWSDIQQHKRIIDLLRDPTLPRAVVNASQGKNCYNPVSNKIWPCTRNDVDSGAIAWILQVRGKESNTNNIEDKFILLSSAGNVEPGENYNEAFFNSILNAAAWLNDLIDPDSGNNLDKLTNTLIIENRKISESIEPYKPGCLFPGYSGLGASKYPGHLSAIGTNVYCLDGPSTMDSGREFSGSSAASPAVAGLAAMVWALKPDLKAPDLKKLLEKTSWTSDSDNTCLNKPAPSIDAYAAMLAVDNPGAITGAASANSAPVRMAVLDVANSNGGAGSNYQFDEHDIQLFLNAFAAAPAHPDYSRYDLNGDGYTGGNNTARFDLNANYDPNTGLKIDFDITQQIEGQTQHFNENAVTDREILCYYAYSPLFTVTDGNGTLRKTLLAELCSDQEEDTLELGDMKVYNAYNYNLYTCDQAIAYCENLVVNGVSGWRLPTRDELKSMVVCTNGTPTPLENWPMSPCRCGDDNPLPFDRPTAIPGLKVYSNDYWATPAFDTTWWRMAFYTSFYSGVSSYDICAYGKHALCVQD